MDSRGVKGKTCISRPIVIPELFWNGSKRSMGVLAPAVPTGWVLNLGCGEFRLPPGDKNIDLQQPGWTAPYLTFERESVAVIHAYHFLEHLTGDEVKEMLAECERVLAIGGVMNICVPYARADLAFQDVDHKTFFTEESWETLLQNPYYETMGHELPLAINVNFIAGVVGRNLAIFTQLEKKED